jgi:hypothetical protein
MKNQKINLSDKSLYESFVDSQKSLVALRDSLGVRPDWHEPDEAEVSVAVVSPKSEGGGNYNLVQTKIRRFDNAFSDKTEAHIVIYKEGKVAGRVNLAYLFSLACGNDYKN